MKKYYPGLIFLIVSVFIISWGGTGHRKISSATVLFLNDDMAQFSEWPSILSAHASDADYRKSKDKEEGPKHYIDIDNYPEFDSTGRIPMTLDSILMYHHPNFIKENGYLPWATRAAYDSVVSCFIRVDWDKAVLFAADLGHYVADGHMPLHITRNYNGGDTGNDGIHSRYESTMIGSYSQEIIYEGDSIRGIENVDAYIFDYLYRNYVYVDSVLLADDYAVNLAGGTSSSQYSAALWEKTKSFTIPLFRNASLALTELIYSAWIEAGKPSMISAGINTAGEELPGSGMGVSGALTLEQNHPNPFRQETLIRFHLSDDSKVKMMVMDESGREIEVLLDTRLNVGEHSVEWRPVGIAHGLYYLVVHQGNTVATRKMIYQPQY